MSKHNAKVYKQQLLIALEKNLGIVTAACKEVGVSRDSYYDYYNNDPEFKRKVDDINEIVIDFAESQLYKKIKEGSERSILFLMKYKGKKRGYTDSIDITSDGKAITEIKLIQVKSRKDLEEDGGTND
jgi:hypothetical protein